MDEKIMTGNVWVFGDNVNTDLIFPNKYKHYVVDNVSEAGKYAMVGVDSEFPKKITTGDIIVAGKNFGCGSSREYAPLSIKVAGIQAVIAKSFGRIFFRNSVNIGLFPLTCQDTDEFETADRISIDFDKRSIYNESKNKGYSFQPLPDFLLNILNSGGLIEFGRKQLKEIER
jgi:3-isopropylmalate/(R)-2-methylmalate dehydratase small subunit